jgi:hypothetical protein
VKNNKKSWLILLVVFIIAVISVLFAYKDVIQYYYSESVEYKDRSYVGNFEDVRQDFDVVTKFIEKEYNIDSTNKYLTPYEEDTNKYTLTSVNHSIISIPANVSTSLNTIGKSIADHDGELVYIEYRNRDIMYHTGYGNYAIVYSPNNKAPVNISK